MATDDTQRLVTGSADAPAQFTIPGNGQMQPKVIFASFDGTGASGAFLPTLKIISDGGEVVGIFPCDTKVAAGASADVSWFPHVAAAAAAAGSGLPFASNYRRSSVTITADNNPHYISLQDGVGTGVFSTNSASVFANDPHTYFGTPIYGIGIHAVGTYRFEFNAFVTAGTAPDKATAYWTGTTGHLSFYQEGRTAVTQVDTWDAGIGQQHISWTEYLTILDGTELPFQASMYGQVAAGADVFYNVEMTSTQISPTPVTVG